MGQEVLGGRWWRISWREPLHGAADDMSFFLNGEGALLSIDREGCITMDDLIRYRTGTPETLE
jgi:hypothetical protein